MKRALACLAAVMLLASGAAPAAADEGQTHNAPPSSASPAARPFPEVTAPPATCKLYNLAILDMATEADGRVTIPATIEDQPGRLMVDTGSIYSVLGESEALARNLTIRPSGQIFYYEGGVPLYNMTRVDRIQIGRLKGTDHEMMVVTSSQLDHDTIGMLGPDIMANYDIDFDFAAGTFSLFDPDHCPGEVVYWTKTPYAAVPMRLDRGGHIIITVSLDGKPVDALVDTGAYRSTISMKLAKALFGIDEKDPKAKKMGEISVNGTLPAPLYRYPFGALTLEGVTVNNPMIDILDDDRFDDGDNEMTLGIKTLRQLHMYIGYKEKTIYFTPAEAR